MTARHKDQRLRAVVLAAGRGERLRPLTDLLPKPLLPVAGRPVVLHTLRQLARIGCEAAALNLHHHGEAVRGALGDEVDGMPLTYSPEETLLGTLGVLGPLREFLEPADLVLLVNGDSLCRWPLAALLRHHRRTRPLATLLVSSRAEPAEFGGGIGLARNGRILTLDPEVVDGESAGEKPARRRVFAGLHVFAPEIVSEVEARPADSVQHLYKPLLASGAHLQAYETRRAWHDLGTPERYRRGAYEWAGGDPLSRLLGRSWRAADARVARGARVRRSVLEAGARIAAGAVVEDSVVLAGAEIGREATVKESIVGDGAELPDGAWVDRQMVLRRRTGLVPRPQDSVLGNLVYTPL